MVVAPSAQRSALHGAGEPGCELDPGSLGRPPLARGTATSRARLLDFIFIHGAHAGGTGVEDRQWKSCTNVLPGWTCIRRR